MNNRLLNYTLATTLVSTVLTAAAPLAATFVDGLFVGNMIGPDAFNAINVFLPISNFIAVLTLICSMGGSVLAAKAIVARDELSAQKIFTISMCSAVGVALLCTLLQFVFMDEFVHFLCSDEDCISYLKDYMGVMLVFFLFVPINSVLNNFVSQEGYPSLTTKIVLASNALNIILDVVFMYVLDMGVKGAALATVIMGATNALAYIPFFMKGKSRFKLVRLQASDMAIMKETLLQGIAFNVFYIMTNLLIFFANKLIFGLLGSVGMQIFGICIQIQSLSFCLVVGISIAGIAQVTRLQGENMSRSVGYVINILLILTAVLYSMLMLAMTFLPEGIAAMFGVNSPEVLENISIPFFCFSCYYLCFAMLAVYTTISFQLMGHVGAKFIFIFGLGIVVYIAMLLMSCISADMLWWGFPIGGLLILSGAVCYGFFMHRKSPELTLFTLVNRMPAEVVMEYELDYECKRLPAMIKNLQTFMKMCEYPQSIYSNVELCCREYCDYLQKYPVPLIARTFNVVFQELQDGIRMVIESAGAPHSVVINESTKADLERNLTDLSQEDIRRLMLATLPEKIEYRYMFGLNVITMTWKV